MFNRAEIPIVRIIISYSIGILIFNFVEVSPRILPFAIIFTTGLILMISFSFYQRQLKYPVLNASILLFWIIVGFTRIQESQIQFQQNHFSHFDFEEFKGEIISAKIYGEKANCQVDMYEVESNGELINVKGRAYIKLVGEFTNDSLIGKSLIGPNKFYEPKEAKNPYGYDQKSQLRNKNIFHTAYLKPNQYTIHRYERNPFIKWLQSTRVYCINVFKKYIPHADNLGVAAAMVLGTRDYISEDLMAAYTDTGSIHVLAVSGLHVGIVSGLILFLFSFIKSNKTATRICKGLASIVLIWFFAFLTGAAPAVLRASLMFSLYFMAKDILRIQINVYNVLLSTAFVLLIYNPYFIFNIGFQFSYLALIGIVFFCPRIQKWFYSPIPLVNKIWTLVAVSIAAQITVFPLSIYYFNKFASSFWLSGIVTAPFAILLLSVGLAVLIIEYSGLHTLNELLVGDIFNCLLSAFNASIHWIQSLPLSHIDNIWFDKWNVFILYVFSMLLMVGFTYLKGKFFVYASLVLLFNTIYNFHKSNQQLIQKKITIYDSYNNTVIDIFEGLTCLSYSENDEDTSFINQRNQMAHGIKEKLNIKNYQTGSAKYVFPYIIIKDQLLIFGAEDLSNYEFPTSKKTTLLLTSKHHHLPKSIDPFDKIILDGSLNYKERKNLKRQLQSLKAEYHCVKEQGAF